MGALMAIGAKVGIRVLDTGWNELLKVVKNLQDSKAYVKAGVFGDKAGERGEPLTTVDLAVIHEFGAPSAGVPERSFIRSSFEKHRPEYIAALRKLVAEVYGLKMSIPKALGIIGLRMATDMKRGITSGAGIPPPNAPATIARKGSDRPLVDTGRLMNSITWHVVTKGSGHES
jgi:hypothetical protein